MKVYCLFTQKCVMYSSSQTFDWYALNSPSEKKKTSEKTQSSSTIITWQDTSHLLTAHPDWFSSDIELGTKECLYCFFLQPATLRRLPEGRGWYSSCRTWEGSRLIFSQSEGALCTTVQKSVFYRVTHHLGADPLYWHTVCCLICATIKSSKYRIKFRSLTLVRTNL